MIGNDIVDIKETRVSTQWERPRFLEKLFTDQEKRYIENSKDAFTMVWQLWSMKESAYKLYTQLNPTRFYNPKAFECIYNDYFGEVTYKGFKCFTKTKKNKRYILSEARLTHEDMASEVISLHSKVHTIQSAVTKVEILKKVSKRFNFTDGLSIKKPSFGIPQIYQNSKPLSLSITMSHHGFYGAFAISEL